MMSIRRVLMLPLWLAVAIPAAAQAPAPPPPPPLWDAQVGASFVGTSGNSDTSSLGANFGAHRRGLVWKIESEATAVRSSSLDVTTAERYLGLLRAARKLTPIIGLTSGIKLERDQFSGLDFRSILDAGLSWALVRGPGWTLDGVTGVAWNHETRTVGETIDHPVGLLQLLSRLPFGTVRRHDAALHVLSRFQRDVGVPHGSRDHRAGRPERPARPEVRIPAPVLERPGARVQENGQHDDRVGGGALEGVDARAGAVTS